MKEIMEKGAGMVKDALLIDPRRLKDPVYLVGKIGGKEIKIIAKEGSVTVEGLEGVVENALKTEKKVIESCIEEVEKEATGGSNGTDKKSEPEEKGIQSGESVRDNTEKTVEEKHDGNGEIRECNANFEERKADEGSQCGNRIEPGNTAGTEECGAKRDEGSSEGEKEGQKT